MRGMRQLAMLGIGCLAMCALLAHLAAHRTLFEYSTKPSPTYSRSELSRGDVGADAVDASPRSSYTCPAHAVAESVEVRDTNLCGTALTKSLGCTLTTKIVESTEAQLTVAVLHTGATLEGAYFVARAVGPTIRRGRVSQQSNCSVTVTFSDFVESGTYSVDIVLTWVGAKYVGQRWRLPDRNDNPPFLEKKRKCLDLSLTGDCSRFGSVVFEAVHHFTAQPVGVVARSAAGGVAQAGSAGSWRRMSSSDAERLPELADSIGLNSFNGSQWLWATDAWGPVVPSMEAVRRCLARQKIRSIALFGDSMMVEMFNMLAAFFDARSRVTQGKFKRLRFMEFTTSDDGLKIRFSRSYTTQQGSSVIAQPATIVRQLELSRPDMIIGNMAVLHWQQNMQLLQQWERALSEFNKLVSQRFPSSVRKIYVGHTQIQMGRTQGLQPSRTESFSEAAKAQLTHFEYFDPLELSHSRREAAFDGQHWACYHFFGGVSMSITQLLLTGVCGGPQGLQ
jgi:hypothetical protein